MRGLDENNEDRRGAGRIIMLVAASSASTKSVAAIETTPVVRVQRPAE